MTKLTAFAGIGVFGVRSTTVRFARARAAGTLRPRHTQVAMPSPGTGLTVLDH